MLFRERYVSSFVLDLRFFFFFFAVSCCIDSFSMTHPEGEKKLAEKKMRRKVLRKLPAVVFEPLAGPHFFNIGPKQFKNTI